MDLRALKDKCLKQNLDPAVRERFRQSWAIYYPMYVTHFVSIRMVWLLMKTAVTPNQVTLFSFMVGGLSALFFHSGLVLWGFLCFEFFYVLDAVDGQLARAKGITSIGGAFLDELGNFIVAPLVVFSIGIHRWESFLAAFSVLMILHIEQVIGRVLVKAKNAQVETRENGSPPPDRGREHASRGNLRFLYALLYRSCTMPVIMNLVTLASLFTLAGFHFLELLILYYASIGSVVWISKVYFIAFKKYA